MDRKSKKTAYQKQNQTVFVGMSGGVDSSVSAALLKKQGYNVVGVFIKTWHPDFLVCNEEEERLDAMRVCAHLDIPFLTFDLEKVYKREVADYLIREYKMGRTPNPDVMCNKYVKFGAFLQKALSLGADFVATGHYVVSETYFQKSPDIFLLKNSSRLAPSRSIASFRNRFRLLKGIDPAKDQSYFLWTLKQEQLSRILFPVGNLKKTEVRKLARRFKIPVAEKKDSQGICFLGAIDLKVFLKHYLKEKKGKVLLIPQSTSEGGNGKGEEIGYHKGVLFYTLGERHGFTILKKEPNEKPYYVVGKDIKKNILYVSREKNISLIRANKRIVLNDTNWIFTIPKLGENYTAQIRYHGEFLPCKVKIIGTKKAEIFFKEPILVASGQSCVVYDHNICLGGGVII